MEINIQIYLKGVMKMKKWFIAAMVMTLALGLVVGCSNTTSNEGASGNEGTPGNKNVPSKEEKSEPVVLKLGHVWSDSEIHSQAAVKFKEEVEKITDGQLKIEIFTNGSLGNDKDLLEGLKIGSTDIWVGGAGVLSGSSDTAQIFTVPFMFDNQDHFDTVYNGAVGQDIANKIKEESGYNILSYWARGARWLTVNKEVNIPEDLSGLKIRVPESPVFVKSWQQLGAAPTPMAFGEVFTSLQQGVIDGQENPLSLIYTSKFNEVVDYLVRTEHVREPITLVISDTKFKSLSAEFQKALVAAANGEAKTFAAEEVAEGESGYLTKLQEGGMTLIEPDLTKFQEKLDGFVDKEFPVVKEVFEKIRSAK